MIVLGINIMLTTIEKIVDSDLAKHAFTEVDLEQLFDGTAASRYALVNKALKKEELIRLRRGLYILCEKYFPGNLSKYYLANRIIPHSYISLESALSYHGWIPERVESITCVSTSKRALSFATKFGEYHYYPIPTNEYEFLTGVKREKAGGYPFLIATPLRALADLFYIKRINWQGIDFLTDSLRIEQEELSTISEDQIINLKEVYRSKRILSLLNNLSKELKKNVR